MSRFMDTFTYHTEEIILKGSSFKKRKIKAEEIAARLNELGKEGWELVSTIDHSIDGWTSQAVLVFKKKGE